MPIHSPRTADSPRPPPRQQSHCVSVATLQATTHSGPNPVAASEGAPPGPPHATHGRPPLDGRRRRTAPDQGRPPTLHGPHPRLNDSLQPRKLRSLLILYKHVAQGIDEPSTMTSILSHLGMKPVRLRRFAQQTSKGSEPNDAKARLIILPR